MKEYKFKINGKQYNVAVGEADGKLLPVNVNGKDYSVELEGDLSTSLEMTKRVCGDREVEGTRTHC